MPGPHSGLGLESEVLAQPRTALWDPKEQEAGGGAWGGGQICAWLARGTHPDDDKDRTLSRFPLSLSGNYVPVTLPGPSLGRGRERVSTTSFPILQMRDWGSEGSCDGNPGLGLPGQPPSPRPLCDQTIAS